MKKGVGSGSSSQRYVSEVRIRIHTTFLFRLSFALIGQFFQVYIHSRLLEQFSESQAGFGTTFKGTVGYQKAGTSSLKRVTGRKSK
jgi:hypothetical protein